MSKRSDFPSDVIVDVTLWTSDGRKIGDTFIPRFNKNPEVLVWGERIFVHAYNLGSEFHLLKPTDYQEAFSCVIVNEVK